MKTALLLTKKAVCIWDKYFHYNNEGGLEN